MERGKLFGVSTGPGDPELMTLKALRCLEQVTVIAAPRTRGGHTRALDIIRNMVDVSQKEIIYLDFAMKKDADGWKDTHRRQAECIEQYLSEGRDVAMLNIGDASLYGTFSYVRELVHADGYETETIPGVTSFCAVAAELEQSLTCMEETLTIIPGSISRLSEELERPGTKVIMKSASALADVKEALREKDLLEVSAMVADCGLPNQRVYQDMEEADTEEGYFATILVSAKASCNLN